MQESVWWWQYSDRYIISVLPHLHTPFFPSLISLMVSVDVKRHVYLLPVLRRCWPYWRAHRPQSDLYRIACATGPWRTSVRSRLCSALSSSCLLWTLVLWLCPSQLVRLRKIKLALIAAHLIAGVFLVKGRCSGEQRYIKAINNNNNMFQLRITESRAHSGSVPSAYFPVLLTVVTQYFCSLAAGFERHQSPPSLRYKSGGKNPSQLRGIGLKYQLRKVCKLLLQSLTERSLYVTFAVTNWEKAREAKAQRLSENITE